MYNEDGDDMVGILLERDYASSLWGQNLYNSLIRKLRLNRITYCHIDGTCPDNLDTVFIIASNKNWTLHVIKQLNKGGIRPILLCSQYENLPGCIYNCVCSDIDTSMQNLLDTLKGQGRNRIALYGINPQSIGDIGRVNSLLTWKKPIYDSIQVFNNKGSLQKCFDDFFVHIDEFDIVICANGFAAVSLVKNLQNQDPEQLERIQIVSCVANRLSDYHRKHIISWNINFEQYGQAALYIYRELAKHPYLAEITVKIACTYDNNQVPSEAVPVEMDLNKNEDSFYSDPELREMLIVDKYLTLSDKIEQTIIESFIQDLSYNEIADQCFFTVSGIKYRTQSLLEKIGAESKTQLIELLKKYT